MKLRKELLFALLAGCTLTLCSCGGNKNASKKDMLNIVYYPGGYGKEYLETFVKEYVAEYKGKTASEMKEGVDYRLNAQTDLSIMTKFIEFEDSAADLIIAGSPNAEQIEKGNIEPITDLLNEKVTYTTDGGEQGEIAIKDYLIPESYKQFQRQYIYGRGSTEVFAMPYDMIPLSLVYNETLMKTISHNTENGNVTEGRVSGGKWVTPPDTYDDLIVYLKDIESYNTATSKKITPLAWCMANANWFESFYINWWAEIQGIYETAYPNEGSFYDFWNRENHTVYKSTGLETAMQKVKDLVYDKNGNYQYTYKTTLPSIIDGASCQSDFAKGNAAICLTGNFFEKEYSDDIAKSGQTFKLMKMPRISNNLKVSDGKGGERDMNLIYCNMDASCYIPAKGMNKNMAKGFMKYIAQEKQIVRFTEMTGGLKPFNCNVSKLSSKTQAGTWTEFQKSVLDLYYGADEVLLKYPKGKTGEDLCPVYTYQKEMKESFFMGFGYEDSIKYMKDYTPHQLLVDGIANITNGCYKSALKDYTRSYGFYQTYSKWYTAHPEKKILQ